MAASLFVVLGSRNTVGQVGSSTIELRVRHRVNFHSRTRARVIIDTSSIPNSDREDGYYGICPGRTCMLSIGNVHGENREQRQYAK